VPLGLRIEKFGARRPLGANKFHLALKNPADAEIPANKVKNHFAAAQFLELTDEQQLSSPPYQLFDSGVSFEGLDAVVFDDFVTQPFSYEIKTLGAPPDQQPPEAKTFETNQSFAHSLRNNTLANSEPGRQPRAKPLAARTIRESYVVADQDSLKPIAGPAVSSEAEARQLLGELRQQNPKNLLRLTVLPLEEAVL
jgi:hypothetical protein